VSPFPYLLNLGLLEVGKMPERCILGFVDVLGMLVQEVDPEVILPHRWGLRVNLRANRTRNGYIGAWRSLQALCGDAVRPCEAVLARRLALALSASSFAFFLLSSCLFKHFCFPMWRFVRLEIPTAPRLTGPPQSGQITALFSSR